MHLGWGEVVRGVWRVYSEEEECYGGVERVVKDKVRY